MSELKRLHGVLYANFKRSHGGVLRTYLDDLQKLVDERLPPSDTPVMFDEPGGEFTIAKYGGSLAFVNHLKPHLVLMWTHWHSHGNKLNAKLLHDLAIMIDARVDELEVERGEREEAE